MSDAQVAAAIQNIPAIAQLKTADGKFDDKAYIQLLATQGLTPSSSMRALRFELATQQQAAPWAPRRSCRSRCWTA